MWIGVFAISKQVPISFSSLEEHCFAVKLLKYFVDYGTGEWIMTEFSFLGGLSLLIIDFNHFDICRV